MSIFANLLVQSGALVDPRLLTETTPKDLQMEREATRIVAEVLVNKTSESTSDDCHDQSA